MEQGDGTGGSEGGGGGGDGVDGRNVRDNSRKELRLTSP